MFSGTQCINLIKKVSLQGGQKTWPLRLTAYIFKTTETTYVIFDRPTIQGGLFLNTSVKSILNKFITQVSPPSDNINNWSFHLQNQARPLYSNNHIFKIVRICTIFSTIERRNIHNICVIQQVVQTCSAKHVINGVLPLSIR